jgi:Spy/CpxP family protein refolding chaperone
MKMTERIQVSRISLFIVLFLSSILLGRQALAAGQGEAPIRGQGYGAPSWNSERPAICQGPWTERGYMRHRMHDRMRSALKQIDLTDAQKTAIHQIKISTKKNMIAKRADLNIAKLELREQLRREPVNMSVVEAQIKKIEGIKTAIMLNAIKSREEVKSTLTAEQRKKLAELMQASRRDLRDERPGA